MDEIDIWRGAASGSGVTLVKDAGAELRPGVPLRNPPAGGVSISFSLPVHGGKTAVHAHILNSSFGALAAAMLKSAPKEAEQAFLSALLKRSRDNA